MATTKCGPSKEILKYQPFPTKGQLWKNTNLPLPLLSSQVGKRQERTLSYVLRSVKLSPDTEQFVQFGSAPNFQGGLLTLCTCKHQMRSTLKIDQWHGMWLAGFTSRTLYQGRHWLFYLAKIKRAYESHADLWMALTSTARESKAADAHYLGDVFRPKELPLAGTNRLIPAKYMRPTLHAHRQRRDDDGWKKDIYYKHVVSHRIAPLLMADPKHTYLWQEPRIYLKSNHCRDFQKWSTVLELIAQLREGK